MRREQAIAISLVLFLLAIWPSAGPQVNAASRSVTLDVKSLVQSVPADGRSYGVLVVSLRGSDGQPLISTSTFSVLLSSSNIGTGTVPETVPLSSGSAFVLTNFTTTTTPGATTVTASAQGFRSGSTVVQTSRLSGFPTAIRVFAAPSRAVAQTSYTGRVIVELVDSRGNPAEASNDTTVSLTSSNTLTATTGHTGVTVLSGRALTSDTYHTGLMVGSTTLLASASGLATDSTTITVVGSTPSQLRATASTNPAPPKSNQTFVIWLLDSAGNPTQAPTDITVSISDSNTSEVVIAATAIITAGRTYVDIPFRTGTATSLPAKLTVSSYNLTSTFVNMAVERASASPGQVGLHLNFAPPTLLANGQAFTAVFVDLVRNGRPYVANTPVNISLVSDNYGIIRIDRWVLVKPGNSFAAATVQTSFRVGSVQITATATNITSDERHIAAFGQSPSRLDLAATPTILPATGGTSEALGVGLTSSNGQRVIAPFNVTVQIVSSNPDVLPVNTTVTIPEGHSFLLVPVTTTTSPGQATITVSGSGFGSASTTVTTVVPGASGLKLFVGPQPGLQTPFNPVGMMTLQLLDGAGNPVETTVPIHVTVTGSNGSVLSASVSLNFRVGSDLLLVPLHIANPGSTQLTATSPGLLPSSVDAKFLSYPLVVEISGSTSSAQVHQDVIVALRATVQGTPLAGATVTWSSKIGTVNPLTVLTDTNGNATTRFRSNSSGGANIVATLLIPGFGSVNSTYHVEVTSSTSTDTGSNSGFFGIDLYTLALAVAAVVAILLVVVIAISYSRRR